ncbi:O-glycoside alpha-1,2-mannosyltransferase 4 [Sphaceloma murrayae]|uniref:O-glycoside alpha-1,2-mannosyltransferase 4 n=1 Tax=Sphaceloma murrayae TaxID=2082308 RepID=A0A2K1QUK3_9PEZI|nr:O-glycoside alpha-1,2-mannosyltransferase 4 [Sphaceloma murrayae]
MAGSAKYMRYVVFAFLCLVLVFFISSSSDIPRQTYNNAAELLKESQTRWKTGQHTGLKPEAPQSGSEGMPPTADLDDLKEQVQKTKQGQLEKEKEAHSSPNPSHGSTSLGHGPADAPRMNATFVTLARNSDVWDISRSIRQVEDRFNHQYHYDWVFLNDEPFDDTFKKVTSALTSGHAKYGLIPKEHWSFPEWIDQDKARLAREDMARRKIIYGDSVSYRHMCRYESGFFFRHPLMLDYEWYWRVEPSIELFCDVSYDPFRYLADHNKKYSFVLSLYEYIETIPTLWDSVTKYIAKYPEHISQDNSMSFISDDGGKTYNKCHFWSNFEIGNLNWLRSKQYVDFFEHLDHEGGFFYERWGDAPVHSIAAALLLPKEDIHFFNDISYYHIPFTHCPVDEQFRIDHKCHCNPKDNFDWNGYSCTKRFFDMNKMPMPPGYNGPT